MFKQFLSTWFFFVNIKDKTTLKTFWLDQLDLKFNLVKKKT